MRLFLLLYVMVAVGMAVEAQPQAVQPVSNIAISLFEKQRPQSLVFRPSEDGFSVVGDGKYLQTISKGDIVYVTVFQDRIRIRTLNSAIGAFSRVTITPRGNSCGFTLQSVKPLLTARNYAGSIEFSSFNGRVLSLLNVDFERYIAGVVEAEVGGSQVEEMYKVQAVIARTYALANLQKHMSDGCNLCDDVHCQAFKGNAVKPGIELACKATNNLVVVDGDSSLIGAVFHSNCGGQTVNSEDVWPKYKNYLRSVSCGYCTSSKNASWRSSLPISQWNKFLWGSGIDTALKSPAYFRQDSRKIQVTIAGHSVTLQKMRTDLGFKSTFFGFKQVGDSIIFSGRGYGHGVGLCQEGAASMARAKYSYERIIAYYYKGCKVVDLRCAHPEPIDDFVSPQDSTAAITQLK